MLSSLLWLLFIPALFANTAEKAITKVDVSGLFVQLSDAMEAVKKDQLSQVKPHLSAFEKAFLALETHQSPAGKRVQSQLITTKKHKNLSELEALSKALYQFEKEQNPVDYAQKRQHFIKRIMPVFHKLQQAIEHQDNELAQQAYKRFNTTWTVNEKVVRETSLGHYGQIETAMTLMRVALLSEPINWTEVKQQAVNLGNALADFNAGNVLQPAVSADPNAPQTLSEGIALLDQAYAAFSQHQVAKGNAAIRLFIQQWAIFEGEVRTRNVELYQAIETELPLLIAKGDQLDELQKFSHILARLKTLEPDSPYGVVDALFILLREGVEALMIIMALIASLNVANLPQAKRWVYGGAITGVVASVIGAIALQQLFPAITAGTNREILEGAVGVLAVIMMLIIGGWLHSKSSIKGWQKFVENQINKALATGSLLSMFGLSFLSVFREGAETILFYAGMLPRIALNDFILGILGALLLLALIAWLMNYLTISSKKWLPIHQLFNVMTWLIYALGFKILGVSIHALQLTNMLPITAIDFAPNMPILGFYATEQGVAAQLIYLLCIPLISRCFKK